MQTSLPKLLIYPSVEGKVMIYKQNGTGRDRYIASNNGGYCKIQLPPPRQQQSSTYNEQLRRSHSISITSKIQLYKSNGTGRDNYIQLTNGGYTTPFTNQNNSDINFANTLRSYDRMAPIQATDFFTMIQRRQNIRNRLKSREQTERQKDLTARLSVAKQQVFSVRNHKRASTPWLQTMKSRQEAINKDDVNI